MRLRRPSTPVLISIALHLVVGTFFVQALVSRQSWLDVFGSSDAKPDGPVERIGFLTLPKPGAGAPEAGRSGGNGRPASAIPEAPPIVAPRAIPTAQPASSSSMPPRPDEDGPATGPLIGGGGKLRGIQPRYT